MTITESQKNRAMELSSKLSEDFDESKTESFARKHTKNSWYHDFKTLFDMIRDKNHVLDKKTYLIIAGALAYVVLPLDIVPDFLLGVGFLDDAFVIGLVIKQLSDEIEAYKNIKSIR